MKYIAVRGDVDPITEALEYQRAHDAEKAKRRKKKLFSVEIDPDTYIAKEVLYMGDIIHDLRGELEKAVYSISGIKEELREMGAALSDKKDSMELPVEVDDSKENLPSEASFPLSHKSRVVCECGHRRHAEDAKFCVNCGRELNRTPSGGETN